MDVARTRRSGARAAGWAAAFVVAALMGPKDGRAQEVGMGGGGPAAAAPLRGDDDHLAAFPLLRTARVSESITLDGVLGEGAWALGSVASALYQTEPADGAPASERSEVRILHDADALYVGARLWQPSGEVRRRLGRRDAYLSDSDWLHVSLDTYHDHTNAFRFSVNPAGVKRDAIATGESIWGDDESWDAVWDVATSVDAEGWTVEMRIPFSQLRFSPAEAQTWGIQIMRRLVERDETSVWSHTPNALRGGPARWGHLVGLEGIEPGRRMEVLPYLTTRAEFVNVAAGDPFRSGRDWSAVAGVDVKYRITSSMTLDVTANPDFGQVEVDPAVVNLSAFETSFDEKRPFFVEGSDIFDFGALDMFYSRRIGRAPQGDAPRDAAYADRPESATIVGAAKLTGQTADGWRLGVLTALTSAESARFRMATGEDDRVEVEPRTGFLVARAEKSFGRGRSTVGAIFTGLQRGSDDATLDALLRGSAYAGGIDFSHEFLNRTWQVDGYFAASRVAGSTDAILRTQRSSARYSQRPDAPHLALDPSLTSLGGYAGRVRMQKVAGRHWRGEVGVAATSPGFEINDLGFRTGADRVEAEVDIEYVENDPGPLFRSYRVALRNSRDWNYGREPVGARSSLGLSGQLANYWRGGVSLRREWATYDDRLTRGGPLARQPAGWSVDVNLNSDNRRMVSGRASAAYGRDAGGGWSRRLSMDVTLRPAGNWTISMGPSLRRSRSAAQYVTSVEDPSAEATFGRSYVFAPLEQTTVSMETRLNLNLSPALSLEVFAQPFVATGDFGDPMRLRAPRTFAFEPHAAEVTGRDFVRRSLRGNAVLRWEWQPGSTLFLVWQQQRADAFSCGAAGPACEAGRFDLGRDARAVFDASPDNVFQLKMTYWLNL